MLLSKTISTSLMLCFYVGSLVFAIINSFSFFFKTVAFDTWHYFDSDRRTELRGSNHGCTDCMVFKIYRLIHRFEKIFYSTNTMEDSLKVSISSIPQEVIEHILEEQELKFRDVCNFASTCSKFWELVNRYGNQIWKAKYKQM